MPVDLKALPAKRPLPNPPDKSKWFYYTLLGIVSSAFMAFSLWKYSGLEYKFWFWFFSLVLPLLFGLVGFIIRLRYHENERDRIMWWNHLHEKKYAELVAFGQLPMGILARAYMTPVANNKLAKALLDGVNAFQEYLSPQYQKIITVAYIPPELTDKNSLGYQRRIEYLLKDIVQQLQQELVTVGNDLYIRILHDGIVGDEIIANILKQIPACQINNKRWQKEVLIHQRLSYLVDSVKVLP